MKLIKKILPHISIILAGMMTVFFIVDRFNSAMKFIDNDSTKLLLLIFSIVSIICSSMLIGFQRKSERDQQK